ncbi:unnamed protein product [Phyllotreta striolata]|uniref:Uncharacterized protein n=1 Tax=Phyllotreta striolata TaxID=444603 RepID=A0A9N9T9S4_PHYSR|nr:unnamed protein product [Phyllotreta striolata]
MFPEEPVTDTLNKCRICLRFEPDTKAISFFDVYFEDLSLAQVFANITSYEVIEDDRLPKSICMTCRTAIINFNNMISIFQETEVFLKKQLFKEDVLEEITEISNAENEDLILTEINNMESSHDADNNDDHFDDDDKTNIDYEDISDKQADSKDSEMLEVKKRQSFVFPETLSNNGEYKYVNTVKYTCECGDCFLYKIGFRHHMQYRHNIIVDDNDLPKYAESITLTIPTGFPNYVEYVSSKTVVKRNKLQCRICSVVFSTKEEVKAHEEDHKTHICDQCGAAFLKKCYLQDHQLMHSEDRRYKCKVCFKAFKHRHSLSVHKRIHDDTKSFVCEICGTGFSQRTTLVTHNLLKHSNVKNFPCPSCNLRFNLKSTLNKHYIRKHTFNREKSFVCNKCGAAYLNKTTLTRHMSDKHLGKAKYFPCTICENKMYVMKKGLRSHMMKKHGIFE